jgi:5,10-methylenetetrahydromethanopterin reductase
MSVMGIGVVIGRPGGYGDTVTQLIAEYEQARAADVSSVWMTQHLGFDALTLISSWGVDDDAELGTAVIPVQSRHPVVLAEQALTAQALCGGRLALGLGLAHADTLEGVYGLPRRRSVSYLSDYLSTLDALMAGKRPTPNDSFALSARIGAELPASPSVLIAALGPRMLQLAGARTAGTITWMTGAATIESYVSPTIRAAAEAAGRPDPRVVVCLPVCVTDNAANARERLGPAIGSYGAMPSYKAMLDREGAADPVDIAIIGNADEVGTAVTALLSRGATDVAAIPVGNPDEVSATWDVIGATARG